MTIQEVRQRYQIPEKILKEYENWGFGDTVEPMPEVREYDDQDIE